MQHVTNHSNTIRGFVLSKLSSSCHNPCLTPSCCGIQVRFTAKQLSADLSHGPAAHLDKVESDWVAPNWFSRSTTKYWVQPQHRMRIKCEIIKNLPVSIYGGQRHKLAAGKVCW